MKTNYETHKLLTRASQFLKQDEGRQVKITLADVTEPVTLIKLQSTIDAVFGLTTTGEEVEFIIENVRMVACVPVDTVGPDDRDRIAAEEVLRLTTIPAVQRELAKTMPTNESIIAHYMAEYAKEGETLEQTYIRESLTAELICGWEPFIERKVWADRVERRFK